MPLTLQQATADPGLCWRLMNTHSEVWVSLLWGHCSFLLGPGAQGSGCALLGSVSPVLCKFWWLYGGVNGTLLQEGLCHSEVCCTQSPCPCGRLLLTHTSAGDSQTLKGRSGSDSVGSPDAHKFLFAPSKCLWWVWHLILNTILPLLQSCWSFSFALVYGVSFFGGIQHSPVNGCSAVSCNFGVLVGEDEHMSFYSTILKLEQHSVVDVTGNGSKVQCCKEQYCIGILDPRIKANWKWSNRRWQE